jgi:LmbE family N-acetylglucosaminyl deacetylase
MPENVLVVAVHPDDETLGCGGTLLRHKKEGDNTSWLIVTSMKEEQGYSRKQIAARQKQIEQVAQHYSFSEVLNLDIPAGRVDDMSTADLVEMCAQVITKAQPTVLYLPFMFDVHSDHRSTFHAIYSATKWFRHPSIQRIYLMETQSETDFAIGTHGQVFVPNYFVDISNCLKDKIKIAALYESEFKDHPFPRSSRNIEALASVRGATSGFEYAEAFQLIKERR